MFKGKRLAASALAGAAFARAGCGQSQPTHGPSLLTQEELNVYQGFLDKLGPSLHIKNLANLTVPFDFKGFPESRPCLNGMELESPPDYLHTTHQFGAEITAARELNLVERHEQLKLLQKRDEASGNRPKQATGGAGTNSDLSFLIFSEIAFDTRHQFAVLKYILVFGEHGDVGQTLVMEKADGQWTAKPRFACAMFLNNSWSEMPD